MLREAETKVGRYKNVIGLLLIFVLVTLLVPRFDPQTNEVFILRHYWGLLWTG